MKRPITYYAKGVIQRILLTLSLIGFSSPVSFAEIDDVTKDILTVFQKDGVISMMLKSDVDSMRLSTVGIDGVEKMRFVTQEIFAKDSLYRFDIAKIDSISFQPAPTVFVDGVLEMDKLYSGKFRDYVIGSNFEFTHLYVDSRLPKNQLPESGMVLFSDKIDKALPNGFVGKVVRIDNIDGYYDIICENVALDDVLVSYCRAVQTVIERDDNPYYVTEDLETISRNAPIITEELIYQNDNTKLPSLSYNFNETKLGITLDDVEADFLLGGSDDDGDDTGISKYLSGQIELQTTTSLKAFYRKILNVPFQMKVVADNEHSVNINIGINGHVEFGPKEILATPDLPIPFGIAFVRPSVNLGILARFEGDLGVTTNQSIKFKSNLELIFTPGLLATPQMKFKLTENPEITHEESLYGEAKLDVAPYFQMNLDVFDKRFLRLSAILECGVEASLKAKLNFHEIAGARYSDALYKRLTQPDCFTISPYFKGSARVSIIPGFQHRSQIVGLAEIEPITVTVTGEPFVKRALIGRMSLTEDYTFDEHFTRYTAYPDLRCSFEKGMEDVFGVARLDFVGFASVKDLTDSDMTDHLQSIELEHLLGEKDSSEGDPLFLHSFPWNQEYGNGYSLFIGEYPQHSYEVTPYFLLSRPKYDEDGNPICDETGRMTYNYYPIKTDIVHSLSMPSQPKFAATYGYPFGCYSGNSLGSLYHMINFEVLDSEDSPTESGEKKYIYIQKQDDSGKNLIKPLDIRYAYASSVTSGYSNANYAKLILPKEEEYDSDFDLGLVSDSKIKKTEDIMEFDFSYVIGFCVKRGDRFIPISSQAINLKKEYPWHKYESTAKWTPNYDNKGNLSSYDLDYSLKYYFPFFWTIRPGFTPSGVEEMSFSKDILKYNPHLANYASSGYRFLRNTPWTIKGSSYGLKPNSEFKLNGYISDGSSTNYFSHINFLYRPTHTEPDFEKYIDPNYAK